MSLEGFADGLADEVMAEMADNFFSARKRIDDLLERFEQMCMELKAIRGRAEVAAEVLHFMLLDEENVVDFYEHIGLDPDALPLCFACKTAPKLEKLPWALTCRSRFVKLMKSMYRDFAKAVDEYMHGTHRPDPENPARLMQTVHYEQVKKLAESINAAIEKLNTEMPASGVLCYAKKMDPARMEKEKVTGGGCGMQDGGLDQDLAFKPVDWDVQGLEPFPEAPAPEECRSVLEAFCRKFYRDNAQAVREGLATLKGSSPDS